MLPGLLQGTPHEHTGHSALIVGRTTCIANGIGLLLRHGTGLAEQLGRQALTAHDPFSLLGAQRGRAHAAKGDATVLTGPGGGIHLYSSGNANGRVVVRSAGQKFDIGAARMRRLG